MEPDSVEEFVMCSNPEEYHAIRDEEEIQKELEEKGKEQKGLTFYHTDLYGSRSRLAIFPEEIFNQEQRYSNINESELAKEQYDTSPEKKQTDLQNEVDELAKLYGLSEEKEEEDLPFLTPLTLKHMEHMSSKCTIAPNSTNPEQKKEKPKTGGRSVEGTHHDHDGTEKESDEKHFDEPPLQATPKTSEPSEDHSANTQDDSVGDAAETQEQMKEQPSEDYNDAPDIFCITCKTPIRAFEKLFGVHKDHDVKEITTAVEENKKEIHKNMSRLEEQITQMENFASHLEEIFVTVEENYVRQEQHFENHYTEVMDAVVSKHEEKVNALREEKTLKLESLYEQLINCGKSLDLSKDLMETVQEIFKGPDKVEFVKTALRTTNRLNEYFNTDINLNISTNAEFESKDIDFTEVNQLLDSINTVPAPSAPVINPQTPNSATATSLRVCWSVFSDDSVESYQLCYRPVCDETPGEDQEEFMIPAKETYCIVNNLMPNTHYEFWVTALNTTAPSPPIIKSKDCRSCENAALICWESGNINPVDSYTVELHKVTNDANKDFITESIVGIPICESLIQLQPSQTYHITVKAVNVGGPSESSRPESIHTTGSFFHLNEETAHPLLSITDNGFTITCDKEESLEDLPYHCKNFTRCIAVLGNLIPFKGYHYWEVEVDEDTQYRVGIAYEDTNRNGLIGANNTSWCLRHILTPSRHKYEFLHCGISPDIRLTIPPKRIGILLDYDHEKLSFFNMGIFQHLFTFDCHFRHFVHPCFALEKPGTLKIHNGIPVPLSVI
ncbi:fibronectin type III and SPRY domain-containing protein 2 isoform X2 [Bombina bombina]|uniref:fibronectin type III and SPRY domain-containing protein 2 isoform X2 n=1 Tax=Bombina bombina TaxID=8345 RepID=UPI00235AD083|nr:fibronectin type III and SPRY domain-containing protein 2 isoform X2 [Bombina bombina]